ncbi:hypothetical protein Dsin_011038 [Dipteronia sinensis]|uniref:Xyloglucan endotransglucosylase/hydrolase n=1 Tax=Dipteronia sinensis TaxID=43782 RepID=A0AAE0AUD8_9ROSI|nr:hypothetical protein Dsin_011038 [Dipteronia sinensis]
MGLLLVSASIRLTKNSTPLTFDEAFSRLYGDQNLMFLDEPGNCVQISLDEHNGSGFKSQKPYLYSLFSASIKLPANNYTAGVVVTFYTSNNEALGDSHDELDFEFLGHAGGTNWVLQTNVYGNGSVSRGREERYDLNWFDPMEDFHRYSILWTENWIVFYVDDVAIREVKRVDGMGGDYPSKPMNLYATIWDGSGWATQGGKYKVNYTYGPFSAQYSDLVINGCSISMDPTHQQQPYCLDAPRFVTDFNGLMPEEIQKMRDLRTKYMTYSYCHSPSRYPTPLPECTIHP